MSDACQAQTEPAAEGRLPARAATVWWMPAALVILAGIAGLLAFATIDVLDRLVAWLGVGRGLGAMITASTVVTGLRLFITLALIRIRRDRDSGLAGGLALLGGASFLIVGAHTVATAWAFRDYHDAYTAAAEEGYGADVALIEGGTVFARGPIGSGFLAQIERLATKAAPISTLYITSEGGLLDEALKTAAFVERHRVAVIVAEYCISACVHIAVASPLSKAHEDAVFGFHQTSLPMEPRTEIGLSWKVEADRMSRSFLERHGVPERILAEADKYEGDSIFEVTARDMVSAGAIKYLTAEVPDR